MNTVVICKECGNTEYWDRMMWLSGKCICRNCYRIDYERTHEKPYVWDDLDGPVPTKEDYENQEKQKGLYSWSGMRKLDRKEIREKLDKHELGGYFLLYRDGTEAEIDPDFDRIVIIRHILDGGEIGVKMVEGARI